MHQLNAQSLDPVLLGKRAVIAGGASGLGRAVAHALWAVGAEVVVVDRQDVEGVQVVADLAVEQEAVKAVRSAASRLGRIDLYVHAPGIARHERALELTSAAWDATLAANLSACAWCCREVARYMVSQHAGSILIIGSTAVYNPLPGESAYRASKAGLRALMGVLAVELAPHGIRVNMLTPGLFRTALTRDLPQTQLDVTIAAIPLGRSGQPDELAPTALLLLSDALSPYTTGADIRVDGGISLRPLLI